MRQSPQRQWPQALILAAHCQLPTARGLPSSSPSLVKLSTAEAHWGTPNSYAVSVKTPNHPPFCKGQPARSILCPSVLLWIYPACGINISQETNPWAALQVHLCSLVLSFSKWFSAYFPNLCSVRYRDESGTAPTPAFFVWWGRCINTDDSHTNRWLLFPWMFPIQTSHFSRHLSDSSLKWKAKVLFCFVFCLERNITKAMYPLPQYFLIKQLTFILLLLSVSTWTPLRLDPYLGRTICFSQKSFLWCPRLCIESRVQWPLILSHGVSYLPGGPTAFLEKSLTSFSCPRSTEECLQTLTFSSKVYPCPHYVLPLYTGIVPFVP